MNPEQLLAHLKSLAKTLGPKQTAGLIAIFIAVVALVVGSAYWISAPTFALLASDLDAESAESIISKLKDSKIPYEMADGGRTIRVPTERVDELRLQFAATGLPSAGRVGFEIFDRPAFGTTEFLEQVNFRRALEGELARTIGTLRDVDSARVHIAMAKDSLFADKTEQAKASVVLRLKNDRPLAPSTVKAITGLVANSVESLRPEAVVVLDTYGRSLASPEDPADAAMDGAGLDREQQLEHQVSAQVVSLLEPVVGAGRVRVNVTARLKAGSDDVTEEHWDQTPIVRSKQTINESDTRAAAAAALGTAGARANLPPNLTTSPATPAAPATPAPPEVPGAPNPAAPAAAGAAAAAPAPTPAVGTTRSSETTNYEVGKVTRHTTNPAGQVARLSVAVIVDDVHPAPGASGAAAKLQPRSADDLQRIQKLVAAAVGFDDSRGDQLTVENIPFDEPVDDVPPAPAGAWDQIKRFAGEQGPGLLRLTGILAVVAFGIFGVARPIVRRAMTAPPPAALPTVAAAAVAGRAPTVEEMEGRLNAGGDTPRPLLARRVAKLASDEPEQVARVMRAWLADGDALMAADPQVSGARKAAIALLAMGDDVSSSLFKFFQEDEIERVVREIAAMGTVPSDLHEQVLTELGQAAATATASAGGVEHARRLLAKTLGPDQSKRILDRVIQATRVQAGFAALEKADPEAFSKFLTNEHPQTIALILAHLSAAAAAPLLAHLPEDLRADVMLRMASLGDIPADVVTHVSATIEQRLKSAAKAPREQRGGLRAVAELFNKLDRTMSRGALERLEALAPDTAVAIRNLMFVFDDLVHVNDAGIREIVNQADKKSLTIALKGATAPVRERFFANMSKRAGDLLREEMEAVGSIRLKDVEKAQQEVVAVARRLEDEGVITTGDGAGEAYVA